jgi:hypothetical protein
MDAPLPVIGVMGANMEQLFATLDGKVKRLRLVALHVGALFPPKKSKKTPSRSNVMSLVPGVIKAGWLEKHTRSSVAVLVLMVAFRPGVSVEMQVLEVLFFLFRIFFFVFMFLFVSGLVKC